MKVFVSGVVAVGACLLITGCAASRNTSNIAPKGNASASQQTGGLSKEQIFGVTRRRKNEIKFCYDQALQKDAMLEGRVTTQFVVESDGTVSEVNIVDSTLDNAEAKNCIISRIRRWKFPEPVGGGRVSVTFPWVFKIAEDQANAL